MGTVADTLLEPPRVLIWGPIRLAGMRGHFSRESIDRIPALWERFMPHVGSVDGRVDDGTFGARYNARPDGSFDYMASVEVDDEAIVSSPLDTLQNSMHRYAVFTHTGHISAIGSAWDDIYACGLRAAGLLPRNAVAFEAYDERFDSVAGQGSVEIWIPVAG